MTDKLSRKESNRESRMGLFPIIFRRHFSPFKIYIRRDLRMVVVLSPKVATTTFRKVLLDALRVTGTKPQLGRVWPFDYRRRHLFSSPSDYFDVFRRPELYRFYCFVRNPYSRLLSAWLDKFVLDLNKMPAARSMKRELPRIRKFAKARSLEGATPGSQMPFGTFVEYVKSQKEGSRNHHWDTQRSVLASDRIEYQSIFQLESEFTIGMSEIFSKIGVSQEWLTDALARPINASDKPVEPVYTKDMADSVYHLYRDDFEEFGYDRDSWRQL
jgi:hypothetical protein